MYQLNIITKKLNIKTPIYNNHQWKQKCKNKATNIFQS